MTGWARKQLENAFMDCFVLPLDTFGGNFMSGGRRWLRHVLQCTLQERLLSRESLAIAMLTFAMLRSLK